MRRRLLAAVLLLAAGTLGYATYVLTGLPARDDVRALARKNPGKTGVMRQREEEAKAKGRRPRLVQTWIPLERVSRNLIQAVIASEDQKFFGHEGIDWQAIQESVGANVTQRQSVRGGSTITQQLAKNLYLSPSRNPLRKLKEMVLAYRLEWALPKDRILALYLNVAEFGPNLWGVEAASRAYFGKSADRLTIDEAAELIATLPHPLTSNPAHSPSRTLARAQLILRHLRGENVEVPLEEPVDSVPLPPVIPVVPIDTVTPILAPGLPADTLAKRPPDSTKPRP